MRTKRTVLAIVVAAGMFLAPLPQPLAGFGPGSAFAKECKLEVEICQEVNLVFWKYSTCWRYKAFCD